MGDFDVSVDGGKLTPMKPVPDVNGFCRHWIDSNGHRFTLERLEWDPERPGHLVLHGESSGCVCMQNRWQDYSHDGPYTLEGVDPDNLAKWSVFGWEPLPIRFVDLERFVGFLLSLTEEEWSHLSLVLDEEDEDFADWFPTDVMSAVWALVALRPIPAGARSGLVAGSPAHLVRDMVYAGHHDPALISAAVLADLSTPEALALPTTLSADERDELVGQLLLVPALAGTTLGLAD